MDVGDPEGVRIGLDTEVDVGQTFEGCKMT